MGNAEYSSTEFGGFGEADKAGGGDAETQYGNPHHKARLAGYVALWLKVGGYFSLRNEE